MSSHDRPGYPVAVIDDHELFRTSLTMALRGEGLDARAVEVHDVGELLRAPATRAAGLIVMDLDLGRGPDGRYVSGADLVQSLHAKGWQVLIVSGSSDEPGIAAAIAAGAIGSVPKSRSFDVLLAVVTRAAAGESVMTETERRIWLERHHRYLATERELSRRLSRLTVREREILELLADGVPSAEIAEHLVIGMQTLRSHVRSILARLEVRSPVDAVALVRRLTGRLDDD